MLSRINQRLYICVLSDRQIGMIRVHVFRLHEPLIVFVDRVIPSWISTVIGSGGMIAMYVAVVLVVGRFVREIVRTPLSNAMVRIFIVIDFDMRYFKDERYPNRGYLFRPCSML